MAEVLRHRGAWEPRHDFVRKFRCQPYAPGGVDPGEPAPLMRKSLLSGELAAPLTLPPPRIRINWAPGRGPDLDIV